MKRIILLIAGLAFLSPAFADAPALCFDSACTAGIQIPGIDDWRQTNIYLGNNGTWGTGVEGSFSHQWYFESMIVGTGTPQSGASTLNGAVTEDFDVVGFLHSLNTPSVTVISDSVANAVELSPFYGYQFVDCGQIYGVKLNLKL